MTLHVQVAALLERVARSSLPPYHAVPAFVARRIYRDTRAALAPQAPAIAEARLVVLGGKVAVRAYRPVLGEALPALVFFHGGGWTIGDLDTHDVVCRQLAAGARCAVFSVDYRLAPEHPFPAALDDCMTTLGWMRAHADELGIDQDRIAVMGMSAGGGLAAAVAQRSHDEGIPLRAQVLVYPTLDDRAVLRDDHAGRGRLVWTPAKNRFGWTSYLGREPRMSDAPEYAAPARRTDLTGLPPAWVGVGDLDLFYDEDVDYAEKLRASGVPCELVTVPGMYHTADVFAPKARAMQDFRRGMTEHLRTYL